MEPEEIQCKVCGEWFPTDHLTNGFCMLCEELVPEELLSNDA